LFVIHLQDYRSSFQATPHSSYLEVPNAPDKRFLPVANELVILDKVEAESNSGK